jgi:hypothetical protein
MDKTLSVTSLVAVLALGTYVAVKPGTKDIVPASASEADVLVTEMVKSGPTLEPMKCCRKHGEDRAAKRLVIGWYCDRGTGDFAPPASWVAKLDKQVEAQPTAQCFEVDPKEVDGRIEVGRAIYTGDAPAPPPMLDELMPPKPVEEPLGEKVGP